MKEKKLYFFYLVCFFLILFLPLLNIPPWFSPPAWGKTIVFRSLMAFLLFAVLIKYELNPQNIKEFLNPRSKIFLPFWSLFAFFSVVFLSTLFSFDVSHSLWGDPSRAGGFVNLLFYFLFCVLGFLIIKKEDWKKLLDFSLIIGVFSALIAVFQQFGVLGNIFAYLGQRPSSMMGNPIILSLYLLPLFFLALSFFFLEKGKLKKLFYLGCLLFFLFTIIFITQTRAAFLGILIGLFWFLTAYPQKKKIFRLGIATFFILASLSFFFLSSNSQVYKNWHPVFKGPVSRIMTLTKGFEAEPYRFYVWKVSMTAFKDRSILGYGPENFSIAFDKKVDAALAEMGKERWFDKAHNSLVEILVTSGIFALVFYLLFISSLFWQLQKIKKDYPAAHGLQSAFLAFLTASFFSIEGFSTFLVFFFLSAFSLHLVSNKQDYLQPRKEGLFFFLIGLPLLIWFLWSFNFKPLQATTHINIAKELARQGNWPASFQILEKEKQRKSFLSFYLNNVYSELLLQRTPKKASAEKKELLEKRVKLLEENAEIKPHNAKNWFYLGQLLNELGETKEAKTAFEKARELSPKDVVILHHLLDVSIKSADYLKLKEIYQQLIEIYPQEAQYKGSLAFVLRELGEYQQARELAEEILKNNPELKEEVKNFLKTLPAD